MWRSVHILDFTPNVIYNYISHCGVYKHTNMGKQLIHITVKLENTHPRSQNIVVWRKPNCSNGILLFTAMTYYLQSLTRKTINKVFVSLELSPYIC